MPKGIFIRSKEHTKKIRKHLAKVRYQTPITSNVGNLNKLRKKKKCCSICKSKKSLELHHIIPAKYNKKWLYEKGRYEK